MFGNSSTVTPSSERSVSLSQAPTNQWRKPAQSNTMDSCQDPSQAKVSPTQNHPASIPEDHSTGSTPERTSRGEGEGETRSARRGKRGGRGRRRGKSSGVAESKSTPKSTTPPGPGDVPPTNTQMTPTNLTGNSNRPALGGYETYTTPTHRPPTPVSRNDSTYYTPLHATPLTAAGHLPAFLTPTRLQRPPPSWPLAPLLPPAPELPSPAPTQDAFLTTINPLNRYFEDLHVAMVDILRARQASIPGTIQATPLHALATLMLSSLSPEHEAALAHLEAEARFGAELDHTEFDMSVPPRRPQPPRSFTS